MEMYGMKLFDLHCDSLIQYQSLNRGFLCGETQFSLRELHQFDKICQTMAIFVPDEYRGESAFEYFEKHVRYLARLLDKEEKLVALARTAQDIEKITADQKCALLLAVEGGAALAGELENLNYLEQCGVKMMTLVWNGENEIASGHNTDKGFTKFGREVVAKMEEKKMIVDVSHLNDVGFEQLCECATRPFIATHSNLRSICSHKRNLPEEYFREIVRREGIVGLNLHLPFLADDNNGDTEALFRHIYRMLELGGEDVIACGSDFDGADIHVELDTPVKFAQSAEYLLQKGISEEVVEKIYYKNAYRFFERNL